MAKVRAFSVPGIHLTIPSGDHEPPHLHASKKGAWAARVYIQAADEFMIEIIRPPDARIMGKDRRAIVNGVRMHRAALLIEWEICQGM
jgi:uncharacterized protein DUF4160